MTRRLLPLLCVALVTLTVSAADWPQWHGPKRDGHSADTGLLKTWPGGGPALAWTNTDVGTGYGQPAVVGDKVYILGCRKDDELVIALDEQGKELWTAPIGKVFDFKGNQWSRGPNSCPSIDGDKLYALGSQGELVCVDTGKREVVWRKNLPKEMGAEVDNTAPGGVEKFGWGFCWSPLVDGKQLVITPGGPKGLFAALDKTDGKVLWQSAKLTDPCTYSSPIVADVDGVRQYIVMVQDGVVGVGTDGKVLWEYRRDNKYQDIIALTPLYHDGHVLISAFPGGTDIIKLTKDGAVFKAEKTGGERQFANFHGGVVLVDKHVYGAHELRAWKCLDFPTGKIKWSTDRPPVRAVGTGSIAYADGYLYLCGQNDDTVALIEASPTGYKETGRFTLPRVSPQRKPSSKFWTHPVIANGRLFLRDQELLFCYKVK
jgi:outer membrane protein assembly factor BamB